jgi:hypothetical protein
MGEPTYVEGDLGMLKGAVMTALTGEQAFYTNLTGTAFSGSHIPEDESLAVVLMHGRPDYPLRIRCLSN